MPYLKCDIDMLLLNFATLFTNIVSTYLLSLKIWVHQYINNNRNQSLKFKTSIKNKMCIYRYETRKLWAIKIE